MTRFEKIVIALLGLQLAVTLAFAAAFFSLTTEQLIEIHSELRQIGWEQFKQGHPIK